MKCRLYSDYILNNGEMTKRNCLFPVTNSSGLLCKPLFYFSDFSLSTGLESSPINTSSQLYNCIAVPIATLAKQVNSIAVPIATLAKQINSIAVPIATLAKQVNFIAVPIATLAKQSYFIKGSTDTIIQAFYSTIPLNVLFYQPIN